MTIKFPQDWIDGDHIDVNFSHARDDHDSTTLDRDEALVVLESLEAIWEIISDGEVKRMIDQLKASMAVRDNHKLRLRRDGAFYNKLPLNENCT